MVEEMAVFKGYLRSLMRQLKALKEAMQNKDYEKGNEIFTCISWNVYENTLLFMQWN